MKLKKILSIFLVIVMILSLCPAALATGGPTVTVGSNDSVNAGEKFVVPVTISGNTGFTNFDLQVTYDETAMTLVSVQKLNCLASYMNLFDGNATTGIIAASGVSDEYTNESQTDYIGNDGTLFKLQFTAKETAKTGNYDVSIAIKENGAFKNGAADVNPTFVAGTVHINGTSAPTESAVSFVGVDGAVVYSASSVEAANLTQVTAPTRDDYTFVGWFKGLESAGAVDIAAEGAEVTTESGAPLTCSNGMNYTLSTAGIKNADTNSVGYYTVSGVTELRPKYDTLTEGGVYNALWLKDDAASAASAEVKGILATVGGETRYYYSVVNSETDTTGTMAVIGVLDTAVTAAGNVSGRIKLLSDLVVSGTVSIGYGEPGDKALVYVKEGQHLTLDLNGCKLRMAEDYTTSSDGHSVTPIVLGGEGRYMTGDCSVNIENSSAGKGAIEQFSYYTYGPAKAVSMDNCVMTIRDVTITASNAESPEGLYAIDFSEGTLESIKNCTVTASDSNHNAIAVYSGGLTGNVESIDGCTLTSTGALLRLTYPEGYKGYKGNSVSITNSTLTSTGTTVPAVQNGGTVTLGEGTNITASNNVVFQRYGRFATSLEVVIKSEDVTVTTTAEGGKVFDSSSLIDVDTSAIPGKIAVNQDNSLAIVEGFTVRFYDVDAATLRNSVAVKKGETVDLGGVAPKLSWPNNKLTYYTHTGWTADSTAMKDGTPIDLSTVITDTKLYPTYTATEGEAAVHVQATNLKGGTLDADYLTLEEACTAVSALGGGLGNAFDCVITLQKDMTGQLLNDATKSQLKSGTGHRAVIDLAGFTLTLTGPIEVYGGYSNSASTDYGRTLLTIQNGTVVAAADYTGALIKTNYDYNEITLEDVTMTQNNVGADAAIDLYSSDYVYRKGHVTLDLINSTVACPSGAAVQMRPDDAYNVPMSLTIDKNSVLTGKAYAVTVVTDTAKKLANASVTVNSGKFKGTEGAVQTEVKNIGTLTVNYPAGMQMASAVDDEGYFTLKTIPLVVDNDGTITGNASSKMDENGNTTINTIAGTGNTVTLSADTVKTLAGVTTLTVTDTDSNWSLAFDNTATAAISTATDKVALTMQDVTEDTSENTYRAAKLYEITLTSGSEAVNFNGGFAYVTIPFTPTEGKTYGVCCYTADNKEFVPATFDTENGTVTFTAKHFSLYGVEEINDGSVSAGYTLTAAVTDVDKNYNPGETVTVNITATSTDADANFGSFGFKLNYDSAKLELIDVTTRLTGDLKVNTTAGDALCGTVGYSGDSEPISSGVVIATATFKVKNGITTSMNEAIRLTSGEMTPYGSASNAVAPTLVGDTVNLYNLKVTFAAGSNAAFGESDATVAYVKYGEAGLFTDDTYATNFTFPTPTANAGYRLANKTGEKLWSDGTNGYADNAAVSAAAFTADTTLTVQTVKTYVISFGTPVNGSYTNGTPTAITVDTGTALSTVTLPAYTANDGYEFVAWSDGTSNINVNAYTVTSDVTLTPAFAAKTFNWRYTEPTGVTMSELTGVTNGKVTYGQNVTFKLTPDTDYVITNVGYAVGTNAAAIITADDSGVYTIPGTDFLGDVTLEVTVNHYHKVVFQAGTGTTVAETTLYVKDGVAGLFTDTACTSAGTVPTVTAQDGYRLAADNVDEPRWSDNHGTNYTSARIAQAQLTEDVTLTAQAIKQYTVTFAVADSTQTSLSGTTSFEVDTGKAISTGGTIPTITYTDGYTFDKWMINTTEYASDAVMLAAVVTSNVTVTLYAKNASYTITLDGGSAATITDITGVTDGEATHGTNVTFKLAPNADYKVTKVAYQIGSGTHVEITANSDGVYTIPGSAITGTVTLVLTSNQTYTITFAAGENGTVGGTISFTLDKGTALTAEQLATVTATGDAGYTFKEWRIGGTTKTDAEITGTAFDTATTITAIFDHGTYTVTLPDGMTNNGVAVTKATHGTNLTITPTKTDSIVTGLNYQVDGGAVQPLTVNADGVSYTIPGDAITGNIIITASTVSGSVEFITAGTYKALALGGKTQIAVLNTAKLTDSKYTLDDGTEFYWSSKYNAYVKIVASGETAQTIAAKLKTATGAATEVEYSGDLNGNGSVTPADAGCVNYILWQQASFTPTDLQRLACDVTGDKKVSTDDVVWVLKEYTGTNN